ncbi:hypothetical protein VP1G_01153 [Cytospora mali]|uniref:Uncharacterized protein n=1 Tax=Cytospora mali TaxID=578113 RepID=A0A194UQF6_CYTMA|nr:hypothetical protein VP1G_01153 [Valsa mali var. pyri (nom. inval.)]
MAALDKQGKGELNYEDLMWNRLRYLKTVTDEGIPLIVALNSQDTGADNVLSTMRWACFTIEAGIGFCWSFQLMQSVYGLMRSPSLQRPLSFFNRIAKPLVVLLSMLMAGLSQLKSLKKSTVWYFFTFNVLYLCFCIGAMFMIGLIFVEFVQTRLIMRKMVKSAAKFGTLQQAPSSIHDRWLVIRVTIPMAALSAFEGYNISGQMAYANESLKEVLTAEPDLSASTAISTLVQFIPGCLAGLVLLICFGTTRQFRRRLYKTFVPKRFQHASTARSISSSTASYAAMDDDPGVLSRQRRLSVERRMKIQVTTEVEIKMEVLDKSATMDNRAGSGYRVEQHHWDDVSPILVPNRVGYY